MRALPAGHPNAACFATTRWSVNGNLLTLNGTIAPLSDRNAKTNFAAVQPREILDKLIALPIRTWNYKEHDPSQRHIGPTAQDFHAAFKVGLDDKSICTVDADGVALAAIQGLNQLLQEKEARISALETELEELKSIVAKLSRK